MIPTTTWLKILLCAIVVFLSVFSAMKFPNATEAQETREWKPNNNESLRRGDSSLVLEMMNQTIHNLKSEVNDLKQQLEAAHEVDETRDNREHELASKIQALTEEVKKLKTENGPPILQTVAPAQQSSSAAAPVGSAPAPAPEYIQVQHNNPSFPMDVYCTPDGSSCLRQCTNYEPRNRIILTYINRAGLGDRKGIIVGMAEMAAYLCATLILPSPTEFLTPMHNGDIPISTKLEWNDFYDLVPWNATPTTITAHPLWAINTPGERNLTNVYSSNRAVWEQCQTNNSSEIVRDWERAKTITLQGPNKRFLWYFNTVWYWTRETLYDHIATLEEGSPSPLSISNYKGGSYYLKGGMAPIIGDMSNELYQRVVQVELKTPLNDTYIGNWHIRRTDRKHQCDSEVPRMTEYIKCTFGKASQVLDNYQTENPITKKKRYMAVLMWSDEQDPSYWQGIRTAFETYAPLVQMIHLDPLARDYLQQQSRGKHEGYDNIYHTYAIVQTVASKANAFTLEHHSQKCNECFELSF